MLFKGAEIRDYVYFKWNVASSNGVYGVNAIYSINGVNSMNSINGINSVYVFWIEFIFQSLECAYL